MGQPDYSATLESIRAQHEANPLSILTLAEPIITSTSQAQQQAQQSQHSLLHPSDISSAPSDDASSLPTPASLTADLQHYRELFSKLRFSYLEQVTKEKYLRSIVGDPPILVSHADNAKLEDELAIAKAALKERKAEVDALVVEMEQMARVLAERYIDINGRLEEMGRLVPEVGTLKARKAELEREAAERAADGDGVLDPDPRMNLSLAQTQSLVSEQEQRNKELDARIAALQRALPGKMRECEGVERELDVLERRRNESAAGAREARRIREEGGRDRLEEMGRWYRSAEIVLNGLGVGRLDREAVAGEVSVES